VGERDLEEYLQEVVELAREQAEEDGDEFKVDYVTSFKDENLLTYNRGIVVRMKDGSEFQLQIIQSKGSRG